MSGTLPLFRSPVVLSVQEEPMMIVDNGLSPESGAGGVSQAGAVRWSVGRRPDAATVVSLSGELDMASADDVLSAITAPLHAGEDVIVDLAALVFIDSSGLRAFVAAHKLAGNADRSLRFRHVGHNVLRAIQITDLDRVFTIEA